MFSVNAVHHGSSAPGSPPAANPPFQFGGHPSPRASLNERRQTPSPITLPIDVAGMLASDEQWIVDALLEELDYPSGSRQAERQPTPPSDRESTPQAERAPLVERSTPPAPMPIAQYRATNAYPYPAPSARQAMWQPQNSPQGHAKLVGGRKAARPRVAMNRSLILKASEELRCRQTTMRYFSVQNAVTERHVRAYVLPDGSLTPLGQRVANNQIRTPADRAGANQPPGTRTALTPEEFNLGVEWIGTQFGKVTRTMFCELLDLDPYIVPSFFKKDGSLTERGLWAREAAIARHGGGHGSGHGGGQGDTPTAASSLGHAQSTVNSGDQPAASFVARAAGTGDPPTVSDAHRVQTTAEACLAQLATRAGISLGFWRGDDFRRLGMAGAPFLGTVDNNDGSWLIFPARGKQYHLAQSPDEASHLVTMNHIVNILLLDAEGPLALVDRYRIARRGGTDAILVTPRPEIFGANPPPATTHAS